MQLQINLVLSVDRKQIWGPSVFFISRRRYLFLLNIRVIFAEPVFLLNRPVLDAYQELLVGYTEKQKELVSWLL